MKMKLHKGEGGWYYGDENEKDVDYGRDLEESFFMRKNADQDFFGKAYRDERLKFNKGGKVDIKIKHPGALHKEMGIPMDKKIPVKALKAEKREAKEDGDTKTMKRVNFALNARKWNKK